MKILAVCLGNICRSPLAEGILRHLADLACLNWEIDSAGTSDWHLGEPPCKGSIDIAAKHGINIATYRARQVREDDLEHYDLILAMDTSNYNDLISLAQSDSTRKKIRMILEYAHPGQNRSVPDSYFTGNYREVFDLLFESCSILLNEHRG